MEARCQIVCAYLAEQADSRQRNLRTTDWAPHMRAPWAVAVIAWLARSLRREDCHYERV